MGMVIKILYAGFVAEITGRYSEELNLGCELTVRDVLGVLCEKHGPRFKSEVYDPNKGELKPNVMVLLNGVNVTNKLDVGVSEGDFITLLPPVSGG